MEGIAVVDWLLLVSWAWPVWSGPLYIKYLPQIVVLNIFCSLKDSNGTMALHLIIHNFRSFRKDDKMGSFNTMQQINGSFA